MRPLPDPPIQLITGEWNDIADLRARVASAMRGGIRWVQLRAKAKPGRKIYDAAIVLAPMVHEAGGLFVVNDRIGVALASGADGVHLPEDGIPVADARRLLGSAAWIARSVHSVDAIRSIEGEPCAVQLGPVYETDSKIAFGPPRGVHELADAAEAARGIGAGLIAVGGITADRTQECRACGADAVAVIGAIWDAADVEAAARRFVREGPG